MGEAQSTGLDCTWNRDRSLRTESKCFETGVVLKFQRFCLCLRDVGLVASDSQNWTVAAAWRAMLLPLGKNVEKRKKAFALPDVNPLELILYER